MHTLSVSVDGVGVVLLQSSGHALAGPFVTAAQEETRRTRHGTEPDLARTQGAPLGPRRVPRAAHRDAAVPGAEGQEGDGRPLRQDPHRARDGGGVARSRTGRGRRLRGPARRRPQRSERPHRRRSRCARRRARRSVGRGQRGDRRAALGRRDRGRSGAAGRQRQHPGRRGGGRLAGRRAEHRPPSRRGRRAPAPSPISRAPEPDHDRHVTARRCRGGTPTRRQSHSWIFPKGYELLFGTHRLDHHLRPAVVEGRPADREGHARPDRAHPSRARRRRRRAGGGRDARRRRSARPSATSGRSGPDCSPRPMSTPRRC